MKSLFRRPLAALGGLLALLAACTMGFSACRTTIPARNPVGEKLPSVSGEALDGTVVRLPEDLSGQRAVLLVGYVQKTQFDLDRWILGLAQAETPVKVLEVPSITGMLPGLYAGFIDDGMRSGIPIEDWGGVVTLYGDDGRRMAQLTGNEGRNGRVLLIDENGEILWFHDRGYSAGMMLELDAAARR